MLTNNCPNCGYEISIEIQTLKMTNCASCGTSLFLDDEDFSLAGEQGVMHDAPLLISIGNTVKVQRKTIQILGHLRYSYGQGWWDEFWGVTNDNGEVWISVDEGDVILQMLIKSNPKIPDPKTLKLGEIFTHDGETYTVTELDHAECIAIQGSFSERFSLGEKHTFFNCTSENSKVLSGEFWNGGSKWYSGAWVDPYALDISVHNDA